MQYYPLFLAQMAADGRVLPTYVQRAFENYLALRCKVCHNDGHRLPPRDPMLAGSLLHPRFLLNSCSGHNESPVLGWPDDRRCPEYALR
ncbi:MAG: hypothetical protein ACREYF_13500 [Gammaproteobacteria bacterium]